jgi:cytochrome P450
MLANGPDAGQLLECYGAIFDYFESIVSDRRRDPRDDLVSAILQAEVDGQSLTDDEVLGFCPCSSSPGTRPPPICSATSP